MKKHAWQGLMIFILFEIIFRIILDPLYFYSADAYTIDKTGYNFKRLYFPENTSHIDYLFVGESQMAAAISVTELTDFDRSVVAVNAGKGYTTGAVHYWAIRKLIQDNPGIIKNSKIIIDFNTAMKYLENFKKEEFKIYEGYSHFILPYINTRILFDFVKNSDCNSITKMKLVLLYSSSMYRSLPFISAKLHEFISGKLNDNTLADAGGIRTDKSSIEKARQLLVETVKDNIEKQKSQNPITISDINNSMISNINELINAGGGHLVFLDMPLHSFQRTEYDTDLQIKNKETFLEWATQKDIKIISVDDFDYSDDDFPDYWHLASNRSAEFTNKFFDKLNLIN